jgi:hypothetical protein
LGDALARQWAEASSGAACAQDALAGFLRLHLDFLAASPGTGEILYGGPPDDEAGEFDAAVRRLLKPTLDALEEAVARGKREKAFLPDVDPAMAAVHFLGVIHTSFAFWTMRGRSGTLREIGEVLFGQWASALSGR